ncbi:GGDEF domain-containing protein [Anaerotignum sp. MB30-C6]|uniref:GGDEF domain-containing protein n=1 Tax=Anaerotignum sp. MB30-C6 TaxID=3070814 RepID=UPI0027DB23E9|nr:GGDEF domain-containing protein [Anaerotignum sp. MB30-C6]WMI81069.1 GGDEF domain-containing protein [Anaerotignum sp. MB30-C6]
MMKYSIQEVRESMAHLSGIFDKVRLVDPVNRRVLSFLENGEIVWEEYFCHKVWNKKGRCENCISLHALQFNQRQTKFEFVNEELYFIVAKPVTVIMEDGTESNFAMEILCKMTDEVFFEAYGKNAFAKRIASVEKKLYEDSLTKVYNRRYFDERLFLYDNQGASVKELNFIMVDLHEFKEINDSFGHTVGDTVLVQTAEILRSCIGEGDAVIRMGGDEFLVILINCDYMAAQRVTQIARDRINRGIKVNQCQGYTITADFGIAYTSCFKNTPQCIERLLQESDKNMYLDKKGINTCEETNE